jgi:hypothetical protein
MQPQAHRDGERPSLLLETELWQTIVNPSARCSMKLSEPLLTDSARCRNLEDSFEALVFLTLETKT